MYKSKNLNRHDSASEPPHDFHWCTRWKSKMNERIEGKPWSHYQIIKLQIIFCIVQQRNAYDWHMTNGSIGGNHLNWVDVNDRKGSMNANIFWQDLVNVRDWQAKQEECLTERGELIIRSSDFIIGLKPILMENPTKKSSISIVEKTSIICTSTMTL